jgi:hypothetical protein
MMILLRQSFFYGFCELIGAGGSSSTAICAGKACNYFLCGHALCKSSQSLRVAVATALETYVVHFAVNDFKRNASGANAARFVSEFL